MNWLDELDAAAAKAVPNRDGYTSSDDMAALLDLCEPERIRAMIACVRAADAMRERIRTEKGRFAGLSAGDIEYALSYDAARAALAKL